MRGGSALVALLGVTGFGVLAATAQERRHSYLPKAGYVPDARTAIRIAVAVWGPIYGEKQIQGQRPYKARLHRGVWAVTGSLPQGRVSGGVAEADIAKRDGRILRVSHGR